MYFRYLVIISPWKRVGAFIWTNLNSLHPRMHCAKFCWNRPSGSGEENFLIKSIYFFYLVIISPWKRAGSFIWTNLYPLHQKNALCQLVRWLWRRRFFNFVNFYYYFLLFGNYLPLEKGGALHLSKFEFQWPKASLCQVWLKLALCFRRRRFF